MAAASSAVDVDELDDLADDWVLKVMAFIFQLLFQTVIGQFCINLKCLRNLFVNMHVDSAPSRISCKCSWASTTSKASSSALAIDSSRR